MDSNKKISKFAASNQGTRASSPATDAGGVARAPRCKAVK